MRRKNASPNEHADNVVAFLSSAEDELDAAKDAFEGGDMTRGWDHYLEAFREIGRAQQELLHASQSDDEGLLDTLDDANKRINELDAVIRRGLSYRIGIDVPIEYIFEGAPPTAVLARADVLGVPISNWPQMRAYVATQMIERFGSARKAAAVLGVSKSTVQAWATGEAATGTL